MERHRQVQTAENGTNILRANTLSKIAKLPQCSTPWYLHEKLQEHQLAAQHGDRESKPGYVSCHLLVMQCAGTNRPSRVRLKSHGQHCNCTPTSFIGSIVGSKALAAVNLKGRELYYLHTWTLVQQQTAIYTNMYDLQDGCVYAGS